MCVPACDCDSSLVSGLSVGLEAEQKQRGGCFHPQSAEIAFSFIVKNLFDFKNRFLRKSGSISQEN